MDGMTKPMQDMNMRMNEEEKNNDNKDMNELKQQIGLSEQIVNVVMTQSLSEKKKRIRG